MKQKRIPRWIWESLIAGLCGTTAHMLVMFLKVRLGWLPSFRPSDALINLIGRGVPSIIPWLSYLNGMTVLGLLFGASYRALPGNHGAAKGVLVGIFVWLIWDLVFYPLFGFGFFALDVGLGIRPALFSLVMVLSYSTVMGIVYSALISMDQPRKTRSA
jgi:hypothetical protein